MQGCNALGVMRCMMTPVHRIIEVWARTGPVRRE
jgi:hypothetical protein